MRIPTRRDYRFNLQSKNSHNWNGAGVHWTQFLNTLSIFFPEGEKFFINSIRHYKDQINDPDLKDAVKFFISQEGSHTREHIAYNKALAGAGMPVTELETLVKKLLSFASKKFPKPLQLAITIALEHITAILADILLRDDSFLKNSDYEYRALWEWHALEEIEHKSVAYDVYCDVIGKGFNAYALRVFAFLLANAIFWTMVYRFYYKMVKSSKEHKNFLGWITSFNYQFGNPGGLRKIFPKWLDYLRPSFHPWDDDNSEFLDKHS